MLKHEDILQRLTKLQKVAIVASALDGDAFDMAGVPAVNMTGLDGPDGVSYGSAARSWDPELVGKMTKQRISERGVKNNLFVAPDLKTTVDPTSGAGLSEDACLNGAMGAEILRGAHAAGAKVALHGPSVTEKEIAYVDADEDYAAVQELFVQPYVRAAAKERCDAVILDPSREGAGYYDTNRALLGEVQNGLLGDDVFIVCKGETFGADAVQMLRGRITLGGCTIPLERAVRRFAQLKAYEDEGSIPHREVQDSIANGSAIDDKTLDELVDNIIDFALTLDDAHAPAEVNENETEDPYTAEQLGEESEAAEDVEIAEDSVVADESVAVEESEATEDADGAASEEAENESSADEADAIIDEAVEQQETDEDVAEDGDKNAQHEIAEDIIAEHAEVGEVANGPVEEVPHPAPLLKKIEKPLVKAYASLANEPVGKRITADSFVLLKNAGLLPLGAGAKVAVLGEGYGDMAAIRDKLEVVGAAKGYEAGAQRSDSLIPAAVRATKSADAVIVFLCLGGRDRLALPANRVALLEALRRAGKRVIAVVREDRPVDLSFDGAADALIISPEDSPYAAEALAELLLGERDFAGRLTRTYYDNADEYFRKFREDRDARVMRVGSFVGYRRYGMDKAKVRYPFGFGLSYATFAYSDLTVTASGASFTVVNNGERAGCEVAQLYIGAPGISRAVPKRQLRAFRKIYLRAGETRRVDIPLSPADFETYDPDMYADTVEAGEYAVYVCSSSRDVRLKGKLTLKGAARAKKGGSAADFASDGDYEDVSKLGDEHRLLKRKKQIPDNLRALRKFAMYALPVFAFLFFVLLSVFIMSYSIDYLMLSTFERAVVEQFMFLAALSVFALLPLVGSLSRKRLVIMRNVGFVFTPFMVVVCILLYAIMSAGGGGKSESIALNMLTYLALGTPILAVIAMCIERQLWRDKMGENRWDKYYFKPEEGDKITSDEDFDKAMSAAVKARAAAQKPARKGAKAPAAAVEVPGFYDNRLTYTQLLGDCGQFVRESGIAPTDETLRNWIAALSSTQLIFVPSGSGAALCKAVAEYFGRKAYVDNAAEYARFDDMFTKWRRDYGATPTALATAIVKAEKEPAYLHTILIRHVRRDMIQTLLEPVAETLSGKRVNLPAGEKGVTLPANVVIIAETEGDRVELPESISTVAAVVYPVCKKCEAAPRRSMMQAVGFERLSAMRQAVRDDFPISEETWKKVDALEEKIGGRISNKIWNRMELHASVVAACGEGEDDAIDGAVAVELMPWLAHECAASELSRALNDAFGEDTLGQSMALIKADGVKE